MAGARALKARFVSPPEHHDGSGRVKVRVAFSEAIEESPENVGEHGVKVEGGRVTSVRGWTTGRAEARRAVRRAVRVTDRKTASACGSSRSSRARTTT